MQQHWESLLTPQEVQVYGQLFKAASHSYPDRVTGPEAVRFFARSGVPNEILSDIWETADRDNLGYLTPETFSVALKLIACAQHGCEVLEPILSTVVPLPQFEGFNPDATGANHDTITPSEREKYLRIFRAYQPVDGVIDAEKAKTIFLKSKLPPETLARIWDLAHVRKSGNLNQTEFIIAMHYIAKVMDRTISQLPTQLPAKVYASASGSIQSSPILRRTSMSPSGMVARQMTGSSTTSSIALPSQPLPPPPPPPSSQQRGRTDSIDSLGNLAFGPAAMAKEPPRWDVSAREKAQYDAFFDRIDVHKRGYIQGHEAVDFFKYSRLPDSELAHIWDLADRGQKGRLTKEEFAVAMHLIHKRLAGESLPSMLPSTLVPPTPFMTPSSVVPPSHPSPPQPVAAAQQQTGQEDQDLLGDFGNNEQLTQETNQVNQLQYQIRTLTTARSNVQKQKAQLEAERDQLSKAKQDLDAKMAQIRDAQDIQNQKLAEMQQILASEEPGWLEIRRQHDAAVQERQAMQSQVENTRRILHESREESERLRLRVHDIQEETARLQRELEYLRNYVQHQQKNSTTASAPAPAAAATPEEKKTLSFDDIFSPRVEEPSSKAAAAKRQPPPPPPPQRRQQQASVTPTLATAQPKKARAPPPPPPPPPAALPQKETESAAEEKHVSEATTDKETTAESDGTVTSKSEEKDDAQQQESRKDMLESLVTEETKEEAAKDQEEKENSRSVESADQEEERSEGDVSDKEKPIDLEQSDERGKNKEEPKKDKEVEDALPDTHQSSSIPVVPFEEEEDSANKSMREEGERNDDEEEDLHSHAAKNNVIAPDAETSRDDEDDGVQQFQSLVSTESAQKAPSERKVNVEDNTKSSSDRKQEEMKEAKDNDMERSGDQESFEMISSPSENAKEKDEFESAFAGELEDAKVVSAPAKDVLFEEEEEDEFDFDAAFAGELEDAKVEKNKGGQENDEGDEWDSIFGGGGGHAPTTKHECFQDAFSSVTAASKEEDNNNNNNNEGTTGSKSNLDQLVTMGFNRDLAKNALARYDQDLEKATNFLLDSSAK